MKDWKKVKLGSLLTESKIVSENPSTDKRLRVRLNMLGVEKRPKTNDKEGATKYYIRKVGQFIYGKQNLHKGAFGIIPEELDGFESSSDIPAFDVDESCYPEWIYYFFKKGNFYAKLEGLAKGVGSKRIYPSQIFGFDIYLPSKEEQREILKKICEVEGKYNGLLSEIEYQENSLSELRQSVFDKAIRGNLTDNWRKENPNIESADKLLERISVERELLIKEKKIKKEIKYLLDKNEILFNAPNNWVWCKLGDVIKLTSGQDLPPDLYSDTVDQGIPYITGASNFNEGVVVINRWTEFPKSIAVKNDLLLVCKGSGVGKVAWLNLDKAHIARQIMAINTIVIPVKYVKLILDVNNDYLKKKSTGIIPGIDRKTILEMMICIPPVEEQIIIIEKIDQLLNYITQLEQVIIENKINAESIIHSSLIKMLGENDFDFIKKEPNTIDTLVLSRNIKYDSKTTFMELIDLLKEHGKLHAEDLWKMSKHFDNKNIADSIDMFYADLKEKIEVDKTIKEVENEKGYIELV